MRIPLSWLRELVDLPADITPEQVHADLVRVGFEEESIRRFDISGPVVVGEVLSREPEEHSNGKTINWCQVRVAPEGQRAADGGEDVRGIVCGAHNFEVADRVVVCLPGAVLPGDFEISARKTYGHVSDGMMASARELGLGDEHAGIIVLAELGLDDAAGAVIGADAKALLGLDDSAVEINVTPDRGYAFSLRGVAREVSHSTGAAFRDPALAVSPEAADGFPVTIDDEAPIRGRVGATGFVTRIVRGIDATKPTPAWMVSRLLLAGVRPLSLPVDIGNYVMLELGNPLHTYDLDKLQGGIVVRRARAGEKLETLDGQERTLDPEDLLITDDRGPIGLAGVMGGESTKADDDTTNMLIEAATFDPVTIARTARRHKLPSEASKRFERGVDPLVAEAAAQRAVDLLVELAGGTVASTAGEPTGTRLVAECAPPVVRLPLSSINALVGADYTDEEARHAIEMIGCAVTEAEAPGQAGTILEVTPPSWRSDLSRPEDLIEEVARIVGYHRIPSALPVAPAGRGLTREQALRRRAANVITASGFDEVQSYPFMTQEQLDTFGAGPEGASGARDGEEAKVTAIRLANALDAKAPFLRRSILPGLLGAAQRNVSRGSLDLALVEFGSVFVPQEESVTLPPTPEVAVHPSDETLDALNSAIPAQPRWAAGVLVGQAVVHAPGEAGRDADWADAIEAAKSIAGAVSAKLEVRQGSHRAFHPGRTAELVLHNDGLTVVGVAGELRPDLVADLHLPGRVSAFELDLDALMRLAPRANEIRPLSTYPAATQDVTLLVDASVPAEQVRTVLAEGAGELLEEARLTDDYRGQGVPEGQRALTFALRFRASDRTLTAEEANEAKLEGVAAADRAFGATLRA